MSTAFLTAERAELVRALAVLVERPATLHADLTGSLGLTPPDPVAHTELFVHQLPPYASIYLDTQGKIGGEARERIGGFWRALHLTPPVEPDHLASLLGLSAGLCEAAAAERDPERRRLLQHSHQALVWEHLVPWLIPYLARVEELSDDTYRNWAQLLAKVLTEGLTDGFDLPIHLSTEPEPLSSVADQVAYVLTPIRCGMLLTRADLRRAATDTRLGLRIGERAFTLKALLDQDHRLTIDWLATEADRQAAIYAVSNIHDGIGRVWSHRAFETSRRLRDITHRV